MNSIINNIKKKEKLFKTYKTKYINYLEQYKQLRLQIRRAYKSYIKLKNNMTNDSRRFWTYYVKVKNRTLHISGTMSLENEIFSKPQDIVNKFGHFLIVF